MFKYKGYGGKIAKINLTTKSIVIEKLSNGFVETWLGGTGFAGYILFTETNPKTDPLGPENVLIFATGPLTGTLFPQSSRYVVAAKSPATGIYGEAHSAGHWGPELKYAGFDALVIYGKAEEPTYLLVENDTIKFKSAKHLWGLTTKETEIRIKEELGDPYTKVAMIGPAGENLVRFAAIINDEHRAAARSGMGAVMGSKKLKAIAIRGTKELEVADPDRYWEVYEGFHRKMLSHPYTPHRAAYGTTALIELMQSIGRLPAYNHRTGVFDEYEKVSGETIRRYYLIKARACFACLQRCGRYTMVSKGPYKYVGGGPEYENLDSLGPNVGLSHTEAVLYASYLTDTYGMDSISTGAVIAWAIECYEKGLITKEDTGGLELRWGDPDLVVKLVKMIAFREGFGEVLAEGVKKASEIIGKGTEKYAMHVKGLEIASQDGRAQKSMGLQHVTSARGADHLYGFPVLDEIGFEKEIKERFGEQYLPEIADRLNPKYKGLLVKESEDFMNVVEAVGVCKYGTAVPPVFFYNDIALALKVTNGFNLTPKDLKVIGERIVNLHRLYNVREGITRKDDTLPERFTKEPMPEGPAKGHVVELDYMLEEYYTLRDWDLETGWPRKRKLKQLGLEWAINEVEKWNKKLPE